MSVSGNIGIYTPPKPEEAVFSVEAHKPVILAMSVKAGQGVLERGTIVGKDSGGLIVPYNPDATVTLADGTTAPAPESVPVGVLVERVDTDKETAGNVLVHGVVFREKLIRVGAAVDENDLLNLSKIGIWNIG